MFGFELQTKNFFVKGGFARGVEEREVAYRHKSGTMTLEGDETFEPGATAALEFVTTACKDKADAHAAVGYASELAGRLSELARQAGPELVFKKGVYGDGEWLCDCTVKVADPDFHAAAQGTVGVPLARYGDLAMSMRTRISPTAGLLSAELATEWQDVQGWTKLLAWPLNASADLRGFITACQMFLMRATHVSQQSFVDPDNPPASLDTFKIFDFSDTPFVKQFYKGARREKYLVKVGTDSPKSLFPILHRTDFHSMFRSLTPVDQRRLTDMSVAQAIWPYGPADQSYIFPLPYRADPAAVDTAKRIGGFPVVARPEWSPVGEGVGVTWPLVARGLSVQEWWSSVLYGDPRREDLRKDVASPPPGFRGRKRNLLDVFPTAAEKKTEYYGMGSFPMDQGPGDTKLAVFEYRGLIWDRDLDEQILTWKAWPTVVDVFVDHYVPAA